MAANARPLPPLTEFNTISELHHLLTHAQCSFVNRHGRKVAIPGYSGDYQLRQVSDRILAVWHLGKLSREDRVALKSLEGKIVDWYKETHASAEKASCCPACIDRIWFRYFPRNEPDAYLHTHEDNIWLSPLNGIFNRGVDDCGRGIDQWVYPASKANRVGAMLIEMDCDWSWTGEEWDFWHNPYVKLSTAYSEEEWREEFGNTPMPEDIWSRLARPVGAIQRKTFEVSQFPQNGFGRLDSVQETGGDNILRQRHSSTSDRERL